MSPWRDGEAHIPPQVKELPASCPGQGKPLWLSNSRLGNVRRSQIFFFFFNTSPEGHQAFCLRGAAQESREGVVNPSVEPKIHANLKSRFAEEDGSLVNLKSFCKKRRNALAFNLYFLIIYYDFCKQPIVLAAAAAASTAAVFT
ncbi:hypothetical protein E2320_009192, partial [Naja naja]